MIVDRRIGLSDVISAFIPIFLLSFFVLQIMMTLKPLYDQYLILYYTFRVLELKMTIIIIINICYSTCSLKRPNFALKR